jgi:hypothetical protein
MRLTEKLFPIQAPDEIVRGFLFLDHAGRAQRRQRFGNASLLFFLKWRRAPLAAKVQNFSSPGNFENALKLCQPRQSDRVAGTIIVPKTFRPSGPPGTAFGCFPFVFNGFSPSISVGIAKAEKEWLEPKQSNNKRKDIYETDAISTPRPRGLADLWPAAEPGG